MLKAGHKKSGRWPRPATAVLLLAVGAGLSPAPLVAQPLLADGQTIPLYGDNQDFLFQRKDGPALAPIEADDEGTPLADGTEATETPEVAAPTTRLRIDRPAGAERDNAPATVLADSVTLDANKRLVASGGVVVWHRGARLVASRVIYDGQSGGAVIEGPIHLTRPALKGTEDDVIVIANSAQLDPNLQDGILRGARLVLAREMQMAAREMRREQNGRFTILDSVVASSCQICASNPIPLWEVRARRITHDAQTRQLHFDQPQFHAFGVPLFSLPALTAPDPTVDRMNGFLQPRFRTTSNLGVGMKLPYFVTLGDHADVTVTPYLAASRTTTLELRYRQAFTMGEMEWNGSLSRDDIVPGETRGYLFGAARFALPRGYQMGVQVQMATDRSYLLDYDISDADRLWSGVTLDRVRRDRMVTARVGNYESLREDEPSDITPSLVGDVIWQRNWRPNLIGGIAALEWSAHAHRRSSNEDIIGRDMARGSVAIGWRRSEILPAGVVGAVDARVDADLYNIQQDSRYDDWVVRADPTLAAEISWPLARHSGGVTHIIQPMAQLVWSPESDPEDTVPNEDSSLLEFDEGNLFSLDRFPGWDAWETGLRANLGVSWTRIDPTGWQIGVTAGRVLRSKPDPALAGNGPLGGKQSDWLVSANYAGTNGLALVNRALFDDSFSLSRNEARLGWLRPGLQLSAGYLWMDADPSENRDEDVSELTALAGWQVRDGWWASAETRYDFTTNGAQEAELGLAYRNECITVEMSIERRFSASDTLSEDTSFDLGIRLGGFGKQAAGPGTVARRSCLR